MGPPAKSPSLPVELAEKNEGRGQSSTTILEELRTASGTRRRFRSLPTRSFGVGGPWRSLHPGVCEQTSETSQLDPQEEK